jgi:hypothetical protein
MRKYGTKEVPTAALIRLQPEKGWSLSLGLGLIGVSTLVTATPAAAAGLSRQEREKVEVRAILAMLLNHFRPGDDGQPYDMDCVTPEAWRESFYPEKPTNAKPIRPHALLTPREALDPEGEHPERFCNFAERDAQAKELAKALPDDDHPQIKTADMIFSYPIFNRSLTRAQLAHEGGNHFLYKNGRGAFEGFFS